jgi:cold shock CspA family protein
MKMKSEGNSVAAEHVMTVRNEEVVYGQVKRTFPDRGYLWLTGDNGTEYWAHASQVMGVSIFDTWVGQRCRFLPKMGPKGPYAERVDMVMAVQ